MISFSLLLLLLLPSASLAVQVDVGGSQAQQKYQPVRPKFYSEITSPLAQLAFHHASSGEHVPSIIDTNTPIPEYESFAAYMVRKNNNNDHNRIEKQSITIATFAGGCFWGTQLNFDREPGVIATCAGYAQGSAIYPTYSDVCAEMTGHTEACLVAYDPCIVQYSRLAELLFDSIPDPTMLNRVGKDRGTQYRTGLYAHSTDQLQLAQLAFEKENKTWFGRDVVTEVKRATIFWPAEEHHQDYLKKGGRYGRSQSSEKGCTDTIRCYG